MSISTEIQNLIDNSPKVRFTDAQLLLQDIYETSYGIFDHSQAAVDNSRPLALVAMHWEEDASTGSQLYERIELFKERQIYQIFGLSLTEFLDLPRDICTKILESCGKKQNEEGKVVDDITRRLNTIGKTPS